MAKFYFTYGTEGHPFYGGWTEVEAPDEVTACGVFRAVHPDTHKGYLNCSMVYDEKRFQQTSMYSGGNLGFFCRERLGFSREVLSPVRVVEPKGTGAGV